MKLKSLFSILVSTMAMATGPAHGALNPASNIQPNADVGQKSEFSKFTAAEDLNFNVLKFGEVSQDDINFADTEIVEQSQVQMSILAGSEVLVLDERFDESGNTLFKIVINNSLYAWVLSSELSETGFYLETQLAGKMITPVRGQISSRRGMRKNPLRRRGGKAEFHAGTDIRAPKGTPIKAAASGVVELAQRLGGYGKVVYLIHPGRIQTRYAHMSQIKVRKGQQVNQGMVIGLVGSTGRSTGPHLHFEKRSL